MGVLFIVTGGWIFPIFQLFQLISDRFKGRDVLWGSFIIEYKRILGPWLAIKKFSPIGMCVLQFFDDVVVVNL